MWDIEIILSVNNHDKLGVNNFIVYKKFFLVCSECLSKNYTKFKNNNMIHKEKLEINKFCKNCNKHRLHKEN